MKIKIKKMHLVFILAAIVAVILLVLGVRKSTVKAPLAEKANSGDIIYYFGQLDNHSKKVDEFLQANKVVELVPFMKKEVLTNKENNDDFLQKIAQCGLKAEQSGVPFVWTNDKCYKGDMEVIEFFKKESGIQ